MDGSQHNDTQQYNIKLVNCDVVVVSLRCRVVTCESVVVVQK